MAAQDRIHGAVRRALIKDGWTITEEPLLVQYQRERLLADLGAEQTIGAARNTELIGVEIKSFLSDSLMHDFELAMGQFLVYRTILRMR